MFITVADSAGFCFGVNRSVNMAEEILKTEGCLSFGQLIHNDDMVGELEKKGLHVIESSRSVKPGDKVIIRAHGVSKHIYDELASAGAEIIDATCPKVKAIHKIVSNASAHDRYVFIIGMRKHPEVEAICGWGSTCTADL